MAETPCLFSPLSYFTASFSSSRPIVPWILTCQDFCTWPVFHVFPQPLGPNNANSSFWSQVKYPSSKKSLLTPEVRWIPNALPCCIFFSSHSAYQSSFLYIFWNYLLNICLPTFFPCYWSMSQGLYQLWWPHSWHIAG